MMTFAEWIATQDPGKWNLDQASINAITDHFQFREICDDERMGVYFWRTLDKYRDRYKALVRVQSIDFDPLVNRYFEAELLSNNVITKQDSSNRNSTVNNNRSVNGTTIGREDITGNSNNTETRDLSTQNTGTESSYKFGKNDDTTQTTNNVKFDGSTKYKTDNKRTTEEGFENYREEKGYTNRYDEKLLSGTITETDRSKTPSSEKYSGTDTTAYHNNSTVETTNKGAQVLDVTDLSTASTREATKETPMSAVNVKRLDGTSDGSGGLTEGLFAPLDFTYATRYGENDNIGKNKHQEKTSFEGDFGTTQTTVSGEGDGQALEYGKEIARTHDDEKKTSYDKYSEKNSMNGLEYFTKSGIIKGTITDDNLTEKTSKDETNEKGLQTVNGSFTEQNNGTSTNKGTETGSVTSVNETNNNVVSNNSVNTNEEGNSSTIDSMTGNQNTTENLKNRNRYTGREGLTPQDAMRSAEEYLLGYSPAFQFIIDKLEINFIAIYDI